ncbi:MAG: 23S rRNA (pseudouridine(1915)-N(3))-methyltransferase RlmH [Lachnospiraceae bacterium]|nr:23S rRNA (pseudouridine(1915)-N(3))-methyltransferase RlmH [Lachnospiraceae bacterium]
MKITILCVGKIKEAFYRDAIAEFEKRLSRYCKLEIIEVADEQTPENASDAMQTQIRDKEGERLLAKLKEESFVATLEIAGKKMDSVAFSRFIENAAVKGKGQITFVIGGSLGLSEAVCKKSDQAISFSDMTFPHQLMRVILCEQIYRGFRIMHGEPYHK